MTGSVGKHRRGIAGDPTYDSFDEEDGAPATCRIEAQGPSKWGRRLMLKTFDGEDVDAEDVDEEDVDAEDVTTKDVNAEDFDAEDDDAEDVNAEDNNVLSDSAIFNLYLKEMFPVLF